MPPPIFEVRHLGVALHDPEVTGRHNQGVVTVEPFGPELPEGWVEAIRDVSFSVAPEEVLAIVGESGGGKTLVAMGSLGLLGPGARVIRGEVFFDGTRIRPTATQARRWARLRRRTKLKRERPMEELFDADWRHVLGTEVGLLVQDPIGAWNPLETLGEQAAEALDEHTQLSLREVRERVLDAFGEVNLPRASKFLAFPNEVSRGQAQRAMLAAALVRGPRLLVADEPLTGLDSGVAAAVLSLIRDMQSKRKMAMIFVTHDLAQVAALATRVAVMYGGQIVEVGPVDAVFHRPQHPYTEGLLGALPRREAARLHPMPGEIPSLTNVPESECALLPRCPYAVADCSRRLPPLVPTPPSEVACIRAGELYLRGV